jgi:hypothetical protein
MHHPLLHLHRTTKDPKATNHPPDSLGLRLNEPPPPTEDAPQPQVLNNLPSLDSDPSSEREDDSSSRDLSPERSSTGAKARGAGFSMQEIESRRRMDSILSIPGVGLFNAWYNGREFTKE